MTAKKIKKCSAPLWRGFGLPAGKCCNDAYGIYIPGPTFRDPYTGETRRLDGKFNGYVPDWACPRHGGPEKTGPRVFQAGYDADGRPMYCAVWDDFINLQESHAEFDSSLHRAIARLVAKRRTNNDQ